MIVALLVLIVLILLFGAGVVKGWIANVVTFGCAGIVILGAVLWLGSFFGEHGVQYVIWTIIGLAALLALVGSIYDPSQASAPPPIRRASPRPPQPEPAPEPQERDRVWGWYESDILLRFSAQARGKAYDLYQRNDVIGLDRLCREEKVRLKNS